MGFTELINKTELSDDVKKQLIEAHTADGKDYTEAVAQMEASDKKASDQEKRAQKLEREVKALKTQGEASKDEAVQALQAELEAFKQENEGLKLKSVELEKVTKANKFNQDVLKIPNLQPNAGNLIKSALLDNIKQTENGYVMTNPDGSPRYSTKTMKPMTQEEGIAEFIEANPFLKTSNVKAGTGSKDNLTGTAPTDPNGRKSEPENWGSMTPAEQQQYLKDK